MVLLSVLVSPVSFAHASPALLHEGETRSGAEETTPEVKSIEWDLEGLKTRLYELGNSSRGFLQRLSVEARRQVSIMERVIERAGLDVNDLSAHLRGEPLRQGGPFIATPAPGHDAGDGEAAPVGLSSSLLRWDLLRGIIETLPLSPPLEAYEVRSSFGKRRDPLNSRWAVHQGADLDAPYKTPIVATAPGTVSFAGWKGSYGRIVEIRHSSRVVTRYAHLASVLVNAGETVERGEEIGLLGNSGRSTGAHLHYEILFDGQHRDPLLFINAGLATLGLER